MPQLHSIWKRKSANDVSLAMFMLMGLGIILWITYGLEIRSLPVIVANGASLLLVSGILTLKLRYGKNSGQ
jgi:MtN3 and saliva related transmembrane protein